MNKIYALVPLAGLILFGGFYWKHSRLHTARLAQIQQLEELARQEKRAKEAAERTKAQAQAAVTMAQRKQDREEKERLDAAQKQARLELEERRNAAVARSLQLRPQADRLRSDIAVLQASIARTIERKQELQQEQSFLAGYVEQAEANQNAFRELLEQLERVESNRAAATAPERPSGSGKS